MTSNILRSLCTRRVLITAIGAVTLFSMTIFSSDGGRVRALKSALSMYDSETGRFPRRSSKFTSDNGTTYPSSTIEVTGLSAFMPGDIPQSVLLPALGNSAQGQTSVTGILDVQQGAVVKSIPISTTAQYRVIGAASGGNSSDPGNWPIELLSLNLSVNDSTLGSIMLRESPTLASTGKYELTPIGGGVTGFHIDSFFDVFTELSLDGGQNWSPATTSIHLPLTSIAPEPGSILIAVSGAVALALMHFTRRRKTSSR